MHSANVLVHVAFGTLALIVGLVPVVSWKGRRTHVRFGRYFLACLGVVTITAVIGVFFVFRPFLAVLTMLAAYEAYSDYRAVRMKGDGPRLQDGVAAAAALVGTVLLFVFMRTTKTRFSPVVVYPTLATLPLIASYDLARFALPRRWLSRAWIYEHLVKMLGAYTAIVSAFAGTVLPRWQPFSQIGPSIVGTTAMIYFIVRLRAKATRPTFLRPRRLERHAP